MSYSETSGLWESAVSMKLILSPGTPLKGSDRLCSVCGRTPNAGTGGAHRPEAEAIDLDLSTDPKFGDATSLPQIDVTVAIITDMEVHLVISAVEGEGFRMDTISDG